MTSPIDRVLSVLARAELSMMPTDGYALARRAKVEHHLIAFSLAEARRHGLVDHIKREGEGDSPGYRLTLAGWLRAGVAPPLHIALRLAENRESFESGQWLDPFGMP